MTGDGSRRVADALRAAIESGEYPPGHKLESGEELAERFDVNRATAMKGLRLLAAEGLVQITPRQRARVRDRPRSRIIVRDRTAYQDEIGYFFDRNAQGWAAIATPTRIFAAPPDHIADLLGIPRGEDVLTRNRLMGPAASKRVLQIATSYISLAMVAQVRALGAENTGPGGIYARIEEFFRVPLEWEETVWARTPDAEERRILKLSAAMPVLVVTRTAAIQVDGRRIVAEVNETRMAAEAFALAYHVARDESARWIPPAE